MRRNKIKFIHAAATLACLLAALPALAGDWEHMKQACAVAKDAKDRPTIEDCAIKIYGLEPLGPQIGSIAPSGSVGLGLRFKYTIMHPSSKKEHLSKESDFQARGLYSFTNFYLMEGTYDFHMPALGQGDATTAKFEDQITLSAFASRINLATQNFYGIGPNSTLAGLAVYRQLQDKVGASTDWPILSWFGIGGKIQWLQPIILGVTSTSVPSVGPTYGNASAPGVLSQPQFMNYQAFLHFYTPTSTPGKQRQTWQKTDVRATYEHYSDFDAGTYSFDRLSANARATFQIRLNSTDLNPPWWREVFCETIPGQQCTPGTLAFSGLVTASYVGSGHSVPFYYQPTLGGTDINGVDTLRGLVDYRLRAPNRVLLQAEFDHDVWGPIGIYGFYDLGKVALQPGDLSLSQLRHDVGVGVSFKVQNKVVLRGYIGFGAGEGSHPNFKLPSAMGGMATFP
ncbi:MAG TPA: hypothetical protein VN948_13400 [Terriglobales bacterium]|nr:hypothetical protein [Terriglobales bacterium]